MIENKYIGIAEDPRSVEDKEKDWKKVEIVSGKAPVKWLVKSQPAQGTFCYDLNDTTWRRFPVRDQDGSSTCVMQTSAKILGINNYLEEGQFVDLSAAFGYSYRVNKTWGTGEGMTKPDVGNILNNKGLTLEVLAPSQKMSEVDINKYVPKESHEQIALVYKTKNDLDLATDDIEAIAQAIASNPKGKAIMLWFKATRAEWNQDCPTLSGSTPDQFDVSHSVTGVDFILWNGEKALVIEDSWGEFYGLSGQRIITESFLKARCFMAKEFVDINNDWRDEHGFTIPETKPQHVFLRDLEFSPVYKVDEEVKVLQSILRYEGFFPTKIDGQAVDITGYYGAITAKAVLEFQVKHNVSDPATLQALRGRRVGPKTREKLNELYGG